MQTELLKKNHVTKWNANNAMQAKLHGLPVKRDKGLGGWFSRSSDSFRVMWRRCGDGRKWIRQFAKLGNKLSLIFSQGFQLDVAVTERYLRIDFRGRMAWQVYPALTGSQT